MRRSTLSRASCLCCLQQSQLAESLHCTAPHFTTSLCRSKKMPCTAQLWPKPQLAELAANTLCNLKKYNLQFEKYIRIMPCSALHAAELLPKPNLQNLRRCCLRRIRGLRQSKIQVIGGGDYTQPQTHHHSVTLVLIHI